MSREAATDGLTQLANRRAFDGALERTLAEASAGGCAVGLILIDVDHFKALNDTHGHTLGDEALRLVGRTLRSLGADGMMPARYGGEEFAIIVADVTESSLRRITERIRRTIEETPLSHDGRVIPFTASLGAFHVDMTACNPTPLELIQRADRCLYEAKEGGRNRVVVARAEPTRA
ncbi:MAG: GGDEF domain-containing protein [Planctomycetota bacterium]